MATLSEQQKTYMADMEKEREFFKKHQGHETQHFIMFVIFIGAIAGSQIVFFLWKRHHLRSFQLMSVMGLWLIPAGFSAYAGYHRFLTIWTLYTIANAWILNRARQSPLHHLTPALVYKWFQILYSITYSLAVGGYVDLLFYGLYFGVFSRDLVDICGDRMAATLGYHSKDGLPSKQLVDGVCAICGANVDAKDAAIDEQDEDAGLGRYELTCGHLFHRNCIRGWCLVGKKDMCPYCKEKVDLRSFSRNPWDTQQLFYLNLLDAIRYLLVWYPIILGLIQLSYKLLGLE